MKTILLVVLLALALPWTAWSDGKVFDAAQTYARIPIPDQQALICFSNGIEHLIIETSFIARGTNFAWVVPVPAEPTVTASTPGLFPTLQNIFRPSLRTDLPVPFGLISLGCVVAYLLLAVRRTGRLVRDDWLAAFLAVLGCVGSLGGAGFVVGPWLGGLVLLLMRAVRAGEGWLDVAAFGLLLPVSFLFMLTGMASHGDSVPEGVTVTARQRAGIFETTTLRATDPHALQRWLQTNGFALPPQLDGAVSNYVRDGWLFVAAKARVGQGTLNTNALHPLAFTFATPRPVYPLQLTGVDNDRCRVDLYVFGPGRASARHFRTVRCEPVARDADATGVGGPTSPLRVRHPELRKWAGQLPVATQLTATLTSAQMCDDAWLEWQPARTHGREALSPFTAFRLAANVAGSLLLLGLLVVTPASARPAKAKRVPALRGYVGIGAVVLGTMVFLALPRVATEVHQGGPRLEQAQASQLRDFFQWQELTAASDLGELLHTMQRERFLKANRYTGQPLRWEDSPGNLTVEFRDGAAAVRQHDADGFPVVVWPILPGSESGPRHR